MPGEIGYVAHNSKGRVRTIGGLERNALCAITPVEPVGARTRSPKAALVEFDPDEICKVTGRSRELRDLMSKHLAAGTVCPNSDDILNESRKLIEAMKNFQVGTESARDSLEHLYLSDKCPYAELQEAERLSAELECELRLWDLKVPPPVEKISEPASLCGAAEVHVLKPKLLWRSGRMSSQRPL